MDTTEAQQWADLAPADLLTFRVYKPERGAPFALDKDGTGNIRLCTPPADRTAVLAFMDLLGSDDDGEGRVLRVVVLADDGGAP
jgi:hypothetical protein